MSMLSVEFTGSEVCRAVDGTLREVRREFDPGRKPSGEPRYTVARQCDDGGWCLIECEVDDAMWAAMRTEPGMVSPFGREGGLFWVQEDWTTWDRTCDEADDHPDDEDCTPSCRQTYVAYAATPHRGYRPTPDRATITWGSSSTDMDSWHKRRLAAKPWRPASAMPMWASRLAYGVVSVEPVFRRGTWEWVAKVDRINRANGGAMPALDTFIGYQKGLATLKDVTPAEVG